MICQYHDHDDHRKHTFGWFLCTHYSPLRFLHFFNMRNFRSIRTIASVIGGAAYVHNFAFCHKSNSPPDPFECTQAACGEKMKIFQEFMRSHDSASQKASNKTSAPKEAKTEHYTAPSVVSTSESPLECPLDRVELGQSTWNLLHTLAANYPDHPTAEQQQHAANFMKSLANLYPCHVCAKDFQENVAKSPPRVESRESLVLWVCEQHNVVNEKLNKPLFACEIGRLDRRWRKGGQGCWDADKVSISEEQGEEQDEVEGS